jgi:CheY-like chemotaxis protein
MTLIALTGWGQDGDRQRMASAGFDRHLLKPVGADDLAALLRAKGP